MLEKNEKSRIRAAGQGPARFYQTRQRVTTGLLLFVVIIGLPMIAVPSLRNRLSTRVMTLKEAMAGGIKPATLQVGENRQPFPAEYARPEPPLPVFPPAPKTAQGTYTVPAPRPRSQPPRTEAPRETAEVPAVPGSPDESQPAASAEPQLKYQKGKAEQDAYDLLLKSNKTVAGLVQGSNPSLKFRAWDAASRGDDVYWVRLRFQSDTNPDEEYIWQVKLQSNEVTPLSHNARSIS